MSLNTSIAFILLFLHVCTSDELVNVKIIEEPAAQFNNFVIRQNIRQPGIDIDESKLKTSIAPADFSGPSHLSELNGKCFDYLTSNYKWIVCPFQNISQFEQAMRWNPYKGVLGVWYEWQITNYSRYDALLMQNGDDCGGSDKKRKAQLYLRCGNKTEVLSANEPRMCDYEIELSTPLVCNDKSLLVYPSLNESLRREWDIIYSDFKNEIITEKAYNMSLVSLFRKSGIYRSESDKTKLQEKAASVTEVKKEETQIKDFNEPKSVEDCQKELEKLRKELKELKSRLNETKASKFV